MDTFKIVVVLVMILTYALCDENRGVNGGMNCAVCTVVTGIVQQYAYLKGISIFNAAKKMCKKVPIKYQHICYESVIKLEPLLINENFLNLFTPDAFCYTIDSCHIDPGEKFCHLFPKPHTFYETYTELKHLIIKYNTHSILQNIYKAQGYDKVESIFKNLNIEYPKHEQSISLHVDFCQMPILKSICDVFLGTFGRLTPAVDLDEDGFSILRVARGSDWRGKDCSDIDPFIYPGAQTQNFDSKFDANCNGIWGTDSKTGRPWEELLCTGTKSKGLIYLGDSIGAHFHFPESWMNPNIPNYSNITTIVESILDELDWPELGFATGFMNSSFPDLINGSVDSIYLRFRSNNLCSHRDYQNGAKNAAMSWHGMDEAKAISKKPSDKPALLIYAMMGNDVCNRFRDTVGNMTTPNQFKKFVFETLEILDKKLPMNSQVVLVSLFDASFIYPSMAERIHPLGSVLNNIKYKDLYNWFSCMQIGPCEGWMTPNVTLQKITSMRAIQLSKVLQNIATTSNYKSLKIHYLQNPFNEAINKWVKSGRQIYELIDPIDSTHPNQIAQPIFAEALWESLKSIGVIGAVNPNNEKIMRLFGDQGGH